MLTATKSPSVRQWNTRRSTLAQVNRGDVARITDNPNSVMHGTTRNSQLSAALLRMKDRIACVAVCSSLGTPASKNGSLIRCHEEHTAQCVITNNITIGARTNAMFNNLWAAPYAIKADVLVSITSERLSATVYVLLSGYLGYLGRHTHFTVSCIKMASCSPLASGRGTGDRPEWH